MKCPNCGNEMVESLAGHLCLSCGHIEGLQNPSTTASIATGKDGHDQSRGSFAVDPPQSSAGTSDTSKTSTPEPPAASEPDTAPAPKSAPEPSSEDQPSGDELGSSASEPPADKRADAPEPPADENADIHEPPAGDKPTADEPGNDEPDPGTPAAADPVPESASSVTSAPVPAPGEATAVPGPEPTEPTDEPKTAPPSPSSADSEAQPPAVPEPTAPEPTAPEPTPDHTPEPAPESVPEPEPEAKPEPGSESKPESAPPAGIPAPEPDPPAPAADVPAPDATSAAPAPASGTAPIASTIAATPAPLNGKPPLTPATNPKPLHPGAAVKVLAIVLAIVLLGGGALAAGYLYLVAPSTALARYLNQTTSAKTASFSADIVSHGSSSADDFSLKLQGKTDVKDQSKPKLDLSLTGQLASAGSKRLDAHIITADKVLYFKIITLTLIDAPLPQGFSENWYKYQTANDANNNLECFTGSKSGSVWSSAGLADIPVKNTAFLGLADLSGSAASHYRGVVDMSRLKAAVDKLNAKSPAQCKLDVSGDDIKNVTLSYEIWDGLSADRLKLTVIDNSSKTNVTLTLDTNHYNEAVNITPPSDAKDAAELINDLFSQTAAEVKGAAVGPETSPAVTPQPSVSPQPVVPAGPSATNDPARRANLAAYMDAYKAKAVKGFFAVKPPAVTVPTANRADPDTGALYTVQSAAPATLGQIQYRPGGACTAPSITPGKTGTRYLALYTLLADGHTLACVDNR